MHEPLITRIHTYLKLKKIPHGIPPATDQQIAAAESALGFPLPPLLKLVYTNIANGGIGPGYGIIGLDGGHAPNDRTLVETYRDVTAAANYSEPGFKELAVWPPGLLPFCEWGCNILSCVDCTNPAFPISQSENCEIDVRHYTLEDFFTMWLNDIDFLHLNSPLPKSLEMINPFTKQKTRINSHSASNQSATPPDASTPETNSPLSIGNTRSGTPLDSLLKRRVPPPH